MTDFGMACRSWMAYRAPVESNTIFSYILVSPARVSLRIRELETVLALPADLIWCLCYGSSCLVVELTAEFIKLLSEVVDGTGFQHREQRLLVLGHEGKTKRRSSLDMQLGIHCCVSSLVFVDTVFVYFEGCGLGGLSHLPSEAAAEHPSISGQVPFYALRCLNYCCLRNDSIRSCQPEDV